MTSIQVSPQVPESRTIGDACRNGDISSFQFFLQNGHRIDDYNLLDIVSGGHLEVLKLIPKPLSNFQIGFLLDASVKVGSLEIFKYLLSKYDFPFHILQPDYKKSDEYYNLPLQTKKAYHEIIQRVYGQVAWAVQKNRKEILEFLLDYLPPNQEVYDQALQESLYRKHPELTNLLVSKLI